MSFYVNYPASGGGSSSNASVGPNGDPIPLDSTLIAGESPTGNLEPLQVDAAGNLLVTLASDPGSPYHVIVDSSALPSGASTESTLLTLSGKFGTLGQKAMAGSAPVVIASDQASIPVAATQSGTWNITNISGTVSLPTGAATAVKQPALGTAGSASADVITVQGIASMTALKVDGTGGTFPISGTVAATQSGTWNITNVSGTVSLPTGASTESTLSTLSGKFGTLGQKAMSGSAPVVLASDQSAIPVTLTSTTITGTVAATQSGTWTVQPGNTPNTTAWLMTTAGKTKANAPARNAYASVNVTTGAYVQLVASLTAACTEIEIFDSSGQTLVLATGGAGSEVDQINIFPGGNGRIPLAIAASTRVSIKAVSATANSGEIDINFYT